MTVKFDPPLPDQGAVRTKDIQTLRLFRAVSSISGKGVFLSTSRMIYRIVENDQWDFAEHCMVSESNVTFTDVHYLDVELVCRDKPQV